MDENSQNEKLLRGPQDQNFLPENNSQLLNAKEFLKSTPAEDLKNIFGHNEPSSLEKVVQNISVPLEKIKPILETNITGAPKNQTENTVDTKKKIPVRKIFYAIILVIFILFLALYIWGAILKNS